MRLSGIDLGEETPNIDSEQRSLSECSLTQVSSDGARVRARVQMSTE